MKKNLLLETIMTLKDHGLTPNDIIWIGSSDGSETMTWEEFKEYANFYYESNPYYEQVDLTLVIVGDDWWLERFYHESLGEWWDFKTMPKIKSNPIKMKQVFTKWKDVKIDWQEKDCISNVNISKEDKYENC